MNTSDATSYASLIVAVSALVIAWYAIKRANKTASAATMVTLNEGFRSAWGRFFDAEGPAKGTELAELLNLFEIACAICLEGSLSGNSAVLMTEYLNSVLRMLVDNDYARVHVKPLLQDENTFIFIKRFLKVKRPTLSITIPPEWYQI